MRRRLGKQGLPKLPPIEEYSRDLVQAVAKGVERFILELRRGRFQVRATVAANLALGEAKNDKVSRGAVN